MSTHQSEPLDETVWDMLMLGLSTGMSPRGERLVLTRLSPASLRHLVRKAAYGRCRGIGVGIPYLPCQGVGAVTGPPPIST